MTAPDDLPLSELCRPLSAKVMPKRAMVDGMGKPLSHAEAIQAERAAQMYLGGKYPAPKKGPRP